jgi:vacuolar-type H+-ATPase catalytic subunit A/Vma1
MNISRFMRTPRDSVPVNRSVSTYKPLVVELGPGIIESIYDGIQRPLAAIREESGDFIHRGIDVPGLSREKTWEFKPTRKVGDKVSCRLHHSEPLMKPCLSSIK